MTSGDPNPIRGIFGNRSTVQIRHDFKRSCYRAMLSEFPPEDVKEYFSKVPLMIGDVPYRGKDLFRLLWKKSAKIPASWDAATDNLLEAFLLEKNADPQAFIRKILWYCNGSSPTPGRVTLTWIYPKLESWFKSIDPRDAGVSLINFFVEMWLPDLHPKNWIKFDAKNGIF